MLKNSGLKKWVLQTSKRIRSWMLVDKEWIDYIPTAYQHPVPRANEPTEPIIEIKENEWRGGGKDFNPKYEIRYYDRDHRRMHLPSLVLTRAEALQKPWILQQGEIVGPFGRIQKQIVRPSYDDKRVYTYTYK
eukprot:GEZU01027885.1.p1 GENE.GEZU01027885.1~~GEZU01027885.1.p1  ORF type:complete len:133 (+),score=31.66 GEZU01027885.1:41-439(+)